MKKKISIAVILTLAVILGALKLLTIEAHGIELPIQPNTYPCPVVACMEFQPIMTDNVEMLEKLIDSQKLIQSNAHNMAAAARGLGYTEEHPVIKLAKEEWEDADKYLKYYQNKYDDIIENQVTINTSEYPVAAEVWIYLTDTLGYSEEVTAGIIGNMMAEVGGQTLALQPSLGSRSYYGICQWSLYYYPEANGMNLQEQLDFLSKTIKSEFNTFGGVYKYGFDYNSFLKLTDVEECAMAFAKSYERCGSGSYGVRKSNALIAYEYFTA